MISIPSFLKFSHFWYRALSATVKSSSILSNQSQSPKICRPSETGANELLSAFTLTLSPLSLSNSLPSIRDIAVAVAVAIWPSANFHASISTSFKPGKLLCVPLAHSELQALYLAASSADIKSVKLISLSGNNDSCAISLRLGPSGLAFILPAKFPIDSYVPGSTNAPINISDNAFCVWFKPICWSMKSTANPVAWSPAKLTTISFATPTETALVTSMPFIPAFSASE